MIGIIAALSPDAVIGVDGNIPWHYPADMKRFKRLTLGATIIMGRLTWESLPKRPLPRRRNIVITSRGSLGGGEVDCFQTIDAALADCEGDVWFIGGARIYHEAMRHADIMDLTYVPDRIASEGAVYFPEIDPDVWVAEPVHSHPDDDRLHHRIFRRRQSGRSS